MSSISREQLNTIKVCVDKIAKSHRVVGICLYGSKAAGYARPNSDFDIIIVLEDYAYTVKYVYLRETDVQISALVVDRQAFEKD
ncbi:MAG TPA: nucleotidyltransferase domain-containing protein, partial [Nitrososphaeraceae archaeon]|nr:nucleotidyltransferase domain-containing protein [Nitrososphaeraceae archaeon]